MENRGLERSRKLAQAHTTKSGRTWNSVSGLSDGKQVLLLIFVILAIINFVQMGARVMRMTITVPLRYSSLLIPLSCNNIWLFHSSHCSLSPACHRSDWDASNSALRLSGWARLAKPGEMYVSLRANGSEVWKWGHPSHRAPERCSCVWWGQRSASRVRRQGTDVGCPGVSPDCGVAQEWTMGASWRGLCGLSTSHFSFYETC